MVLVATNENHTSSSSVPKQALLLNEAVAFKTVPELTEAQFWSGLTITGVAQQASSFATGSAEQGQGGQLGPPQSMPISRPFRIPSVQLAQLLQKTEASQPGF